jgi:hypothetical protein
MQLITPGGFAADRHARAEYSDLLELSFTCSSLPIRFFNGL